MKPRLESSKKWTKFPKSYQDQIEQVFAEAFGPQLKTAKLIVEGRIYPEEICLRIGFLENGRLTQINFEVSSDYKSAEAGKSDAVERIHDCIDAVASLMQEYFAKDGEVEFPIMWKNFDFEGRTIWVQFSTVNSSLEAEANRLLGVQEETLLVDNDDGEDGKPPRDDMH